MSLSRQQRKEIHEALLDAFPTESSLEQMLSFELDKKLREIAGEGNLQQIIFRIIETAKAQGWIEDLISAAKKINPGNVKLQAITQIFKAALQSLWIPYPRNPFFTGRETVLEEIRNALVTNSHAALSGLGGIGKTQTAIEYAYLCEHEYQSIFWVRAEFRTELVSGFVQLAESLNLPISQEKDENLVISAVKQWLATHSGWLLILDNADEILMLREFLPEAHQGHILLTTRAQATGIYQRIEIKKLPSSDGALLLLRRAKLIAQQAGLDAVSEEERTLAETISQEMDGLPLALDQAGAFIEETPSSLTEYWQLYQAERETLLAQRGELAIDHASVTITFSLAFAKVLERNPTAADLIRVSAFLAPDAIPEEIFTQGAAELGENLSLLANKPLNFVKVISEAGRFSLIYRNPNHKTFDIHRLVQFVLKAEMDEDSRHLWAQKTVCAVTHVFPNAEHANWGVCERLLPHAKVAINWIKEYQFEWETAALLLARVGYYLTERGRYSEAEPLYIKALELRQRLLTEEHLDVTTSYHNLARLYRSQGRYSEAEPLYIKALEIWQRLLGQEHPWVAIGYSNLAGLYRSQGRYSEAEPLYVKALELGQRLLGQEHPHVATRYNNLALLYRSQGRYTEAEPLFIKALELSQRLLGQEHPHVAIRYSNLAGLYMDQGRYSEAEPLLITALELGQRLLGQEHPHVACSYHNLALLYRSQGRYSEAEPLFIKALELSQRLLGQEHPDVACSYHNLAGLYMDQGRYTEAEPLFIKALELSQRLLGQEHPHVAIRYSNLAGLYMDQGRYSEAEPLFIKALEIWQRLLTEEHPWVATGYNNLAGLYKSQERYTEAEPLFIKALELRQRLLGQEHPKTITIRENLKSLRDNHL
ncbi:MAG: FxSxx-COOH system tetratricopeptide repeat protein [Rhizonema sp. PD37]|nr:FxSxx-COOH system tetratricopeptide repeat protein [Rhizonema sp. PD37]